VWRPTANAGVVIERLAHYYSNPLERIATLCDQVNDVLMFQRSGLSIAMGNLLPTIVERANVREASAHCLRTSMA